MGRAILNLIERQTKLFNATACNKGPRDYCSNSDIFDSINTTATVDDITQATFVNLIPDFFKAHTGANDTKDIRDFNDPDKNRGFLSLQETNFELIGPDRDFCDYFNIDQVMKMLKKVKKQGF